MLSASAGVYTFHHDPGALSAAFVWPRTVRTPLTPPPAARYLIGGWSKLMDGRSGALDMPGFSWRDRPVVNRGDGVFLAGDMLAAPGLLSEVAWASAVQAGTLAVRAVGARRAHVGSRRQSTADLLAGQ